MDNRAIVRRYLEKVVSGGDFGVADELVSPDLVFTSPYTPEPIKGLAGFKGMIGMLRSAFPDLKIEERDVIAVGDRVATRWIATGTHTGAPFAGQAAAARQFSITGMSIYRLSNGKIVEGWVNDDNLGMMVQLGAVSMPAAAR